MTKALAAFALLALTACVQFTQDQLPKRSVDTLSKSKIREVEFAFQASYRGTPTPENEAFCYVILLSGLKQLFVEARPADGGNTPLRLEVVMGARPPTVGESVWNEITILTAYTLPWRRQVDYELVAQASWNGKLLKMYDYRDSMSLWIWWPFLPVMITNSPSSDVAANINRNLVANFLDDLSVDLDALDESAPSAE